jgi:hypothetical protein
MRRAPTSPSAVSSADDAVMHTMVAKTVQVLEVLKGQLGPGMDNPTYLVDLSILKEAVDCVHHSAPVPTPVPTLTVSAQRRAAQQACQSIHCTRPNSPAVPLHLPTQIGFLWAGPLPQGQEGAARGGPRVYSCPFWSRPQLGLQVCLEGACLAESNTV